MNAKCGSCGGTHETINEYRLCSGAPVQEDVKAAAVMDNLTGVKATVNTPGPRQVRYALDLLADRVWPDEITEKDLKGMERRQVSNLIDSLQKAPRKARDRKIGAKGVKEEFKDIPDGRYALGLKNRPEDEAVEWRFFQVRHGHSRIFLDLLFGAPGAYRHQQLYGVAANKILEEIRRITPRQASIDFGLQSKTCGVCSSPLTNPDSLEYGIGPVCRNKRGW